MKTSAKEQHTTTSKGKSQAQSKTFVPKTSMVQKKEKIEPKEDASESETDIMAETVVHRMAIPPVPPQNNNGPLVQKKCGSCVEENKIRTKPISKAKIPSIQRNMLVNDVGINENEVDETPNIQTKKKGDRKALSLMVQTKLEIGQINDPYEQEADSVADAVMGMESSNILQAKQNTMGPLLQLKCKACEEDSKLQLKADGQDNSSYASDSLESTLASSVGGGRSMETALQQDIGSKMGVDFSGVRIHTDSRAAHMNEELGALAFTHGSDVYFNSGMYKPNTHEGKHLLVHELTHVLQQTGNVQTFRPPQIQKFDAHDEIQEKLRDADTDLITEAPIPGGQTLSKGFTSFGYADLYKSTGSILPGIFGAKHRKEEDEDTQETTDKYAYKNVSSKRLLHTPQGTFTRSPEVTHSAVSVFEKSDGTKEYFKGKTKIDPANKGSLITGAFPDEFSIGDIKKGDDNLMLAKQQITNYRKGMHDFSEDVKRHFGVASSKEGKIFNDIKIPPGLDYSQFNAQNGSLGDGNITHVKGGYTRRYWLYPYKSEGIYLYIWLPHPWDNYVPKFQRAGKTVMDELEELNKRLKVTQKKPTKRLDTKRKKIQKTPKVSQNKGKKVIQKKDTDWKAHRKEYFKAREKWKTDHGNKYLKNKDIDKVVETKVDFDDRVGISKSAHGNFKKVTKQFNNIEFWAGFKGKALGEARFLLGEKFDVLADKFEKMKERTKKTRTKARGLSGSKLSFGWKKKVIGLLMEGFKAGFSVFIEEVFAVFAGCIDGMIQKFQESFTEMDEVETLLAQLEELKSEIEVLINDISTKYEAQMEVYEGILEKMEDIKFYADILSTAETLIRVGVQVVSCLSPPALGCLWGLVAQIGLEAALSLVMGTEWFEEEFMRPLVKEIIDEFLEDDILTFMNTLFTEIGLADYIKDVEACKVNPSKTSSGGVRSWYIGSPTIPPSRYKSHAALWEANNKDLLLSDIAKSFSGGTTGKKISNDDVEALMKIITDKKMDIQEFKDSVMSGKVGKNKFDFDIVKGGVENSGEKGVNGDGTSNTKVIDGSKVASDEDRKGQTAEGASLQIAAKSSHTKGDKPELTIYLFEAGEHIATIVKVPSEVVKRLWWPSEDNRKKLQIHYHIPKMIPIVKGYFIEKGRIIKGYAKP